MLSYDGEAGVQVVSLGTGLVGGGTIQSYLSGSMSVLVGQALNNYNALRALEELMSKVPIVHVEDVVQAHIFAMENSDMHGRYLCANAFFKSAQIASLIHKYHPDINLPPQSVPFAIFPSLIYFFENQTQL